MTYSWKGKAVSSVSTSVKSGNPYPYNVNTVVTAKGAWGGVMLCTTGVAFMT
jgi:hypothetical protein